MTDSSPQGHDTPQTTDPHARRRALARHGRLLGTLVALVALVAAAGTAGAARLTAVSPQGEVAQVRQIVLRFDTAVVPLGQPRAPDPVRLSCQGPVPAGSGAWQGASQWVYDFREALPPGVRCSLSLNPGFKPLDGAAITAPARLEFQTGGPAVDRIEPEQGQIIEEDQHFLLRLTGPVVEASLAGRAWCEVEGIGERLPARIITGNLRDQVLRERQVRPAQAERHLLLACQRPLPQEARVRLVWGPGIAARAHPALVTRAPQSFDYSVRRAFLAEFSCERERAQAPCLPIRPMRLTLSEPVPRALAAQVRLRPLDAAGAPLSGAAGGTAPGGGLAPVFDKDDRAEEVGELRFPTPLAEKARYRLELPPGFKDASGRALANAGSFPLTVATGEAPPIAKFAAAPFGILERLADPVLPLTLRHVQGDLRPGAPGGQVRVLRVQEPRQMLEAYAQVLKHHERDLRARDAGLPQSQWYETVTETDERGREVRRRVDRMVGTRELSLLKTQAQARRMDLPALQGGDPRPFEVVGIPLPEPGLHVVEIESARLGQALLPGTPPGPMYVRTAALVTNLGVHVKIARDSSLVWVTSLDRARPVADAEVQVFDCTGKPLWNGRTDAQGRAVVAQPLQTAKEDCLADYGFFVTARKTERGVSDTAFAFSSWNRGIDPWRFGLPLSSPQQPAEQRAHTVFDRTLLRAGETVSMKHFLRTETASGLADIAPADRPPRARLTHEGSGQEFVVPLHWSGVRSATSQWTIPPAAPLGRYAVSLQRDAAAGQPARSWDSGSFRVEEFRVPLVDARLVPPKGPVVAPSALALEVQMNHQSGGPMAQAALRGSAQWRERQPEFPAFAEFSFAAPRDPQAAPPPEREDEAGAAPAAARLIADRMPLNTDAQGAARWQIPLPPPQPASQRPGEIRAELSYTDPNGEIQTVSTRVPTWPAGLVLGVRTGSWASVRGPVPVRVLALDLEGRPLQGQAVELRGRLAQMVSSRKRMVGGFYAYDNRTDYQDLGVLCSGRSDAQGLVACDVTLERAGEVELIAQARDGEQRLAQAATSLWVTQQGELWFAQDNDDRIDVLPERRRYAPGETARLQVRMPFREATALVAIEREGIIDTRIVTLRGRDPTVELRIEPGWGPNVYVSVLAVRGRVREVPWYSFFSWGWKAPLDWFQAFRHEGPAYAPPTAMVDLSKPAHKFGVAALQVGTAAHELKVQVSSDQPQYTIRGKAIARIQVTGPDGKPAPQAEIAFAAVDEGLLALQDNLSWDLLAGMIRERAWGVETATAQSEVIGRRHYGRKAVAAGGGGGKAGARELFDTLLVWKPALTLDARGEATVEVPLNDSLTSFRLVAVADAGSQTFGHGHARIRVTQDLQVLPGLPPLVRGGDRFQALVTVRNTTARELKLRATLVATAPADAAGTGAVAAGPGARAAPSSPPALPVLAPQELTLPAQGARELQWTVEVPAGLERLSWEAAAEEVAGGNGPRLQDRVRREQRVQSAVPVRVLQASLQQLDGPLSLPVAAPADALSVPGGGRLGGLAVGLQPRLGGALPGIRRFFETYPYTCLEQQASRAVGLGDRTAWNALMAALPTYLDGDGLAAYFPPRPGDAGGGSDRLTAYLLSTADEAGWDIPAPALGTMLQGLSGFVQGRFERRHASPRPDLDVRKLAALAALARHGKADPRMLGSIRLTAEAQGSWPTAALIDWLSILQRVPGVPERDARRAEAQQQLRARLDMRGTTLRFSREEDDFWWWLMDSPDSNAARLILAVMDEPGWKEDLPRLVSGHLGRQKRGQWLTTTANAWSALALDKFAAAFERTPVAGVTRAGLAGAPPAGAVDWTATPAGGRVQVPWPATAGQLAVTHEGSGKPWVTVQSLAAIPLAAPLRLGYGITRSVQPVEQKTAGRWSRGDVLRVRLEIDAQADMSWVVVNDPVPAGATVLGSGLGRDATLATAGERREGSAWPAYTERSFEAFRSYYAWLPRGRHVVEYSLRLNNPGRFQLPPSRVEALYAPDSFGEAPNAPLEVGP